MRAVLWLVYKWKYSPFPMQSGHEQDDQALVAVPYPLIAGPLTGIYAVPEIATAVDQLVNQLGYLSWTLTWRASVHPHAWCLPDGRVLRQDDVVERLRYPEAKPDTDWEHVPEPEVLRYPEEIGVEYLIGDELVDSYDFADMSYRCEHCGYVGKLFASYPGDEAEACHHCRHRLDQHGPSGFGALELTEDGYRAALAIVADTGNDPFDRAGSARQPERLDAGADNRPETPAIAPSVPDDAMLSPASLAALFGVPKEALRSRLKRWREKNLTGFGENENRSSRQAKYLYKVGDVRSICLALKATSETTSKRPAKK